MLTHAGSFQAFKDTARGQHESPPPDNHITLMTLLQILQTLLQILLLLLQILLLSLPLLQILLLQSSPPNPPLFVLELAQ